MYGWSPKKYLHLYQGKCKGKGKVHVMDGCNGMQSRYQAVTHTPVKYRTCFQVVSLSNLGQRKISLFVFVLKDYSQKIIIIWN